LQAIASDKSICRPNLLLEVTGLITKYAQKVNLVWLPSHIGIKGNEMADRLAGAAAMKPDIDINLGLELPEAYNLATVIQLENSNTPGIRKPQVHTTDQ